MIVCDPTLMRHQYKCNWKSLQVKRKKNKEKERRRKKKKGEEKSERKKKENVEIK